MTGDFESRRTLECINHSTWDCGCPDCRLKMEMLGKPKQKPTPKIKLSRKESGLMLSVLDNYVIECDNRSDRKNIDSPEWLALQRLARDVENIVAKIREAGRNEDSK